MSKPISPFNLGPLILTATDCRSIEQVKVPDVFEGSTESFHDEGLFSNRIFGNVGSEQRDSTVAYIDLKLPVIHPFMLKLLFQLKSFYKDLIGGKVYATWDETEKDFVIANAIEGRTGFFFFLTHWKSIVFKRTSSRLRDEKIAYYEKYKNMSEMDKLIVYPAGLRDVQVDETGRVKKDAVNDIYASLIGMSNAISSDSSRNSDLMDTTRLSLQNGVNKVYDHFDSLIGGKGGSIQKKLTSRTLSYGTRNVVTPFGAGTVNGSSEHSPNTNDTIIGLYQLMNALLPYVQTWMIDRWTNSVFSNSEGYANLINPDTLKPEQVRVSPETVDRWTTSAGVSQLIDNFQYPKLRNKPVLIEGRYLALIYQSGTRFKVMSTIDELPEGSEYSVDDVHPMTYIEMFYLCNYQAWNKWPILPTRYPVEGNGSIYASKVFLRTTLSSFQLYELGEDWKPLGEDHLALTYPDITSSEYMDAMSVHPCHLRASGGD